jgi:protein-disulfide isomerase
VTAPDRRLVLAALAAVAASPALAEPAPPPDMALGDPKAKVTVVEYASLSCPHCARWANDVYPAFKAKYVDTGKVRYVLREFLTEPASFAAAGWLTARCAGPDKYFTVVADIFRDQAKIYETGDVRGGLMKIAQSVGLSDAALEVCLGDKDGLAALQSRVELYIDRDKIDGTPTFLVNGVKLEGEHSLEAISAAVDAALAAKPKRGRKR